MNQRQLFSPDLQQRGVTRELREGFERVPRSGPARSGRDRFRWSQLRKRTLTAAAVLAACFGLAQVAQADTLVVTRDFDSYTSTGQFGQAGEWGISSISGLNPASSGSGVVASGNVFHTFCLERNESLAPGTYNWSMSDSAHNGGVGGATNNADPISAATAYLFGLWWNGQLTDFGGSGNSYDYSFGSGRTDSALQLQNAIWFLEQELTTNHISQSSIGWAWAQAALTAVGSSTDIGNVRVLTLTDSSGAHRQDLLVMVPIPQAAAIGLGLMSAIGLVGFVRRRKNRSSLV